MKKKHLAIVSSKLMAAIFEGLVTIDARFSKNRTVPYGQISAGDTVYLKQAGEDITGQYIVKKIISFENPQLQDWQTIALYFPNIEKFQKVDRSHKFVSLIFMTQVERFITSPIKITKKDNKTWMVID